MRALTCSRRRRREKQASVGGAQPAEAVVADDVLAVLELKGLCAAHARNQVVASVIERQVLQPGAGRQWEQPGRFSCESGVHGSTSSAICIKHYTNRFARGHAASANRWNKLAHAPISLQKLLLNKEKAPPGLKPALHRTTAYLAPSPAPLHPHPQILMARFLLMEAPLHGWAPHPLPNAD